MDTLILLAYGDQIYRTEAAYCLLSAFAFLPPASGRLRYVIYTDKPEQFASFGIEAIELSADTIKRWHGEWGYVHRAKTFAILDALERYPGKVVYLDSDTYFRRSPRGLFSRVGPGRSVMHVREYRFSEQPSIGLETLQAFLSKASDHGLATGPGRYASDETMWNAGVVGLHSSDRHILRDVVELTDTILSEPSIVGLRTAEQFATTHLLARNTRLRPANDIVFHYWPPDFKTAFRAKISDILAASTSSDLRLWGRRARRGRPAGTAMRRLKMGVRTATRALGLRVPGTRTSV